MTTNRGAAAPDPKVQRLGEPRLKHRWFVAVSEDVPGGPPVADHLLEHLQSQIALEKTGLLAGTGPLTDDNGVRRGLVVLRCADRDEAVRLLDADPLHAGGSRRTLHTWQLNEGRISLSVDCLDQTFDLR